MLFTFYAVFSRNPLFMFRITPPFVLRCAALLMLTGAVSVVSSLQAAPVAASGIAFATPVKLDNLDPAAFAEWSDEKETVFDGSTRERAPQWVIVTDSTTVGHSAVAFGDSKVPGPRHLRIGFKTAIPVGSVLVRGGGKLSVLKATAQYPGDLSNDDLWTPAQRLDGAEITTEDADDFALWVLPPGTTTRALRFSHVAAITDLRYAGQLAGALVIPQRFGNVAPQATASASINPRRAKLINNEEHDSWKAWENQEKGKPTPESAVISRENPEWLSLTWRTPVKLTGLVALWAGSATVEVQTYAGPAERAPDLRSNADWRTVGEYSGLKHGYPVTFMPNRLDFGKEITTRALRIRLLEAGVGGGHSNNNGGRRVWMGELMALTPLGTATLDTIKPAPAADLAPKPPIAIKFNLKTPGYVTLVIEKPDGFRVRNLVSETPFPAGENTVWWDGTDDLGRDVDAAMHGVYKIPARFVEPGEYRVRGLVRGELKPYYEFSAYTTGNPPWNTADGTGAWLANHSPPQAAAFVPASQSPTGEPAVFLGCYVTEGPAGFAWVDLDGRKRGGKRWIGGNWTAAPFIARDAGAKAVTGVYVYVASAFETGKKSGANELRLTAVGAEGDKSVLVKQLAEVAPDARIDGAKPAVKAGAEIGGIAVHDGIIAVALTVRNQLAFVDARDGKVLGLVPLDNPRGVAFDAQGRLHALSGKQLVRYDALPLAAVSATAAKPVVVVANGLEDPSGLTIDAKGSLYVSDRGNSHQVKIFTTTGQAMRTIGKSGVPAAGPYDPLRMQNPAGLAVDSKNQIWVTERDFLPKRVSVWSADGKLINAFYGPGKYGGGGALDPKDKTKFYYADDEHGAMEFKLDWTKGSYELAQVYYRRSPEQQELAVRSAGPETALYHEGRRYFTNAYNSSPTSGSGTAFLFIDQGGLARPVAGAGRARDWPTLKEEAFKACWPAGFDFDGKGKSADGFFIWSDQNEDARAQPNEVTMLKADASGVTIMPDLAFCIARLDSKAVRFAPVAVSPRGIPSYNAAAPQVLAADMFGSASSGGNQALAFDDGWMIASLGMKPFEQRSVSGALNGIPKWSYPNMWPGLHASHRAPRPDRPGQLIGMTRMPGGSFEVAGTDVGPLWALHSNHGSMAVFTRDGLFVANLFTDMRSGKTWRMPKAERNMDLAEVTLGEENFWPTLTHASGGKVYLVDGARSAIVRIDGFDTLRRLPDQPLTLTKEDLDKSRAWQVAAEAARQQTDTGGDLIVTLRKPAPVVDGKVDEWPDALFVDIDKSGVRANFNSSSKPYDVTGAVGVAGDRLYAAWRADNDKLLENSGDMPLAPFKTGGALDLMIGADPTANPARTGPVAGDSRLLVTLVKGKPRALLYRGVVPGTKDADKVPFSSPWRTITLDKVEDVTAQIQFGADDGNYEISIPLATLGLKPRQGLRIKGDIGILRGNGTDTTARVYWSNKAAGITADVPAEASLTPALWGIFEFKTP